MIWPLLFIAFNGFAQIDLTSIQKIDDVLPNYSEVQSNPDSDFLRTSAKYNYPTKITTLEKIQKSGTNKGSIQKGSTLRNLKTNQNFAVTKQIYVNYFNHEDEFGFKYLKSKDGSIEWRIPGRFVEPLREDLTMYERPHRYTPAPVISKKVYDKGLKLLPEVSFYSGFVRGNYMRDLFEDNKARSGLTNQYGFHLFTKWDLPVQAGLVFHYEKAIYPLAAGGEVVYSSPSFGPQLKTKTFETFGHPIRFQFQYRVSPFAKATASTQYGSGTFKFNSSDLLASLERPIENRFGEFVLGLFVQAQWLNIKNQTVPVRLRATNEINQATGLSLAQVF
jgi:hypothetical protein